MKLFGSFSLELPGFKIFNGLSYDSLGSHYGANNQQFKSELEDFFPMPHTIVGFLGSLLGMGHLYGYVHVFKILT